MDLPQLTCGACGANLDVPNGVRFVNCLHCGASLKVQRNDSVAYTEVLEAIQENTDMIKRNTEILCLQGQLAQLDREWDETRMVLMVRDNRGGYSLPSRMLTVVFGLVVSLFAWGCSCVAIFLTGFLPFAGVGFLVSGVVVFVIVSSFDSVSRYQSALCKYEEQRESLLDELDRVGG